MKRSPRRDSSSDKNYLQSGIRAFSLSIFLISISFILLVFFRNTPNGNSLLKLFFVDGNSSLKPFFQFFFYLLLIIGVTSVIKGIFDLFVLGLDLDSKYKYDLQDFRDHYRKIVGRIAFGLFFIFSSLIFIWLL
jgi:flagellar biosynthesis protein FlhB